MTISQLINTNKTLIMGIVNMTPDSFSDGGAYNTVEKSLDHIQSLLNHGADILDIGAESTKPGSSSISIDEECSRLEPVLKKLQTSSIRAPISLDTSKPEVAELGLHYGVTIINDVQGTTNKDMWDVVSKHKCHYVCMHMQNKPKNMQVKPLYFNVVDEVKSAFVEVLEKSHICKEKMIFDPGIGFGKTLNQNLELIHGIPTFKSLKCPLLIGTSRKSFIGDLTGEPVTDRLEGTIASSVLAIEYGISILRVHDVQSIKRAVLVADAIRGVNNA
jgi:dihydropteroate synthase